MFSIFISLWVIGGFYECKALIPSQIYFNISIKLISGSLVYSFFAIKSKREPPSQNSIKIIPNSPPSVFTRSLS